ncbi:hypothetical protein [Vibrio sp. SCSIO 43136]|uniref:hypothetical protein n=1 Tax=Vibrio sp. SCSIO 43136 TaxID=2819101 RepID=UPI0033655399
MSATVCAEESVQDMSDPLAVYTQVGSGYTNKGLNIKLGQTFDTGSDHTMGMNVFELKGIMGDTFGWDDNATNSIDQVRFRRFGADLTNGRGSQIDSNYNFQTESGTVSYSVIQALPKLGAIQLYPLAGLGVAVGNNVVGDDGDVISGYSVPGTFAVVGTYAKLELSDKIWLNYNPMWMSTLSGSETFTNHGMENGSSVLAHEFAASYQINPRLNVRYFANWSENDTFKDGDHRLEVNYQL